MNEQTEVNAQIAGQQMIAKWESLAITKAQQMLKNDTFFPFIVAVKNRVEDAARSKETLDVMDVYIQTFACYGAIKAAFAIPENEPHPLGDKT